MEKFLIKRDVTKANNGSESIKQRIVDDTIMEVDGKQGMRQDMDISVRGTQGNINSLRTLFEIVKLSDLRGEVQQIEFSSPLLSGDYRLMEVSPKLAEQIESGVRLVFRGELDDSPVLCSTENSYRVKEAETTNTLLVMPNLHFFNEIEAVGQFLTTRKVIAMQSRYIELCETDVVSLSRLKDLLRETELQWGEDEDSEKDGKLRTFEDLLDIVQMSEMQLKNALECLPVIHQNGCLRMLSLSYRDRLLTELIECCDDEDEPNIEVNSIGLEALCEALRKRNPTTAIPREAILWLLKSHCCRIDGEEVFMLNERAVCRSKISQLLRASIRFEYSTFEKLIRQMLPEGIEMKDEYLNGLALVEESLTRGKTIRYLNVDDMPQDELKRLELLFSMRSKWKVVDIQNFFTDLCPTSRALNEMLAKHCRYSSGDGERYLLSIK